MSIEVLVCPGCGKETGWDRDWQCHYCVDCGINVTAVLAAQERKQKLAEQERQRIQLLLKPAIAPLVVDADGVPQTIKRWSWPAFIFGWLWCFFNNLPVWGIASLLGWILTWGFAGLIIDIVLGVKGNKYAWKAHHFASVEEYWQSQQSWVIATWILVILVLGGIIAIWMSCSSFAAASIPIA